MPFSVDGLARGGPVAADVPYHHVHEAERFERSRNFGEPVSHAPMKDYNVIAAPIVADALRNSTRGSQRRSG